MSLYYGLEPVCYPAKINHIRSQTMKYIVVVKKNNNIHKDRRCNE